MSTITGIGLDTVLYMGLSGLGEGICDCFISCPPHLPQKVA
jgi:hypothetical protein